ncbi:UDP-N-acetylmuramoyl-tripeptide--D-alanyl-D-alanine ligase [Campylobacter sp. faydin G-105]|uniref:Mur ligase family protein n=1 Tax=Campylobacter anatolicus TaxID=2829105 RepID=UPI001B937342|nr:UDP-N-acetylmuramoyl-tripeptide--D-alanyl-D-alanine ligase [Campylobacter anatolicus]MBR8462839.1 UDP-N-acetylmuramoyl-tripeptide--D-alanyl-D-alanine ligase [Campylobacter anatolicus]
MNLNELLFALSSVLFAYTLAFYTITCFQWFSYKIKRVLFHFTRPAWHVFFFIVPLVLYYTTSYWFFIYFYFAYLPSLFLWHKKLDKKLVFTARVKRYFLFLSLAILFGIIFSFKISNILSLNVFVVIVVSLFVSHLYEKLNAIKFKLKAEKKLVNLNELKIVMITASFGKTSIKNFLYELLKDEFNCHKTPRSVNTLVGLIKDINENINNQTQIYIAEAGARLKGDIAEITAFLRPHIAIVGEIGAQHLEYFKTIENIRATKLEALSSDRLEMAFFHSTTLKEQGEKIQIYNTNLKNINANLDGLSFELDGVSYHSPLLGKFNAENLAVCIKVAKLLGVSDESIKRSLARLENVEHRLQKIEAMGKLIIDDSFNGNFAGMSASYELVATYSGRKVLVTPGIVESVPSENENLGKVINEIFDIVIITSSLNLEALLKFIKKPQVLILKDKTKMQEILALHTRSGDVVLFSNDAPSFM